MIKLKLGCSFGKKHFVNCSDRIKATFRSPPWAATVFIRFFHLNRVSFNAQYSPTYGYDYLNIYLAQPSG